jgi:hypothetical protein
MDHPDDRPLYTVARRAPTRSQVARRACNSPPPCPIKGDASPQPRGEEGDELRRTQRIVHSLSYSPITSPATHQGLGSHASSPALLVLAPLQAPPVLSNIVPRAHHCWTYGPLGRNQDNPCVICCLASTIEG